MLHRAPTFASGSCGQAASASALLRTSSAGSQQQRPGVDGKTQPQPAAAPPPPLTVVGWPALWVQVTGQPMLTAHHLAQDIYNLATKPQHSLVVHFSYHPVLNGVGGRLHHLQVRVGQQRARRPP